MTLVVLVFRRVRVTFPMSFRELLLDDYLSTCLSTKQFPIDRRKSEYLAETRRANARNCAAMCMQIKGNEDEFTRHTRKSEWRPISAVGWSWICCQLQRPAPVAYLRIWFRATELRYGAEISWSIHTSASLYFFFKYTDNSVLWNLKYILLNWISENIID